MSSSHSNFNIPSTTAANNSHSSSLSSSNYFITQELSASSNCYVTSDLEEKNISAAKEEESTPLVRDTLAAIPTLTSLALATLVKSNGSVAGVKKVLKKFSIDLTTGIESKATATTQINSTLFHLAIDLSSLSPRYQLHELSPHLKSIAEKLLNHTIRGERDNVAAILNANLIYLPMLLRVSGKVIALATGLEGEKVEHEGTMYQLALHEGDVSFRETNLNASLNLRDERCGLRVMTTRPYHVSALPANKNCAYILVQPTPGREPTALYFIDKREKTGDKKITRINYPAETKTHNSLLTQLFPTTGNSHYYADIPELSPSELTAITVHTGHSHEEGLANMLERYSRILQDGELEFANQFNEQIENTREQVAAELAAGKLAIDKFFQVLKKANNTDEDRMLQACANEFNKFKNYFIPKHVQRGGRNLYSEWAVYADEMRMKFYEKFGGDSTNTKSKITWQRLVGYLQRFVSACDGMALAQGPYYLMEEGEKLQRSLAFRNSKCRMFDDSDLNWVLGKNCAGAGGWGGVVKGAGAGAGRWHFCKSYVEQKHQLYHITSAQVEKPRSTWPLLL